MSNEPTYYELKQQIERMKAKSSASEDGTADLGSAYVKLLQLMDDKVSALSKENKDLKAKLSEIQNSHDTCQRESTLSKTMLDSLPCAVMLISTDYKILAANKTGQNVGAIPGMLCYDTWGRRENICPWCLLPKVLANGQIHSLEIELNQKLWDVTWVPLNEDLFLYLAFDITEKKQVASIHQHVEKLTALGTLMRDISNDFNNILTGIQGRASIMLQDTDSSDDRYEHLSKINEYAGIAGELTSQLLEFGMVGNYHLQPEDLNAVIKKSVADFENASENHIVHQKLEEKSWIAEIDRHAIERVLRHIYNCAWQIEPDGGEIVIKAENVILEENHVKPYGMSPGQYVKISIADSGIGVDHTIQENIFDPFFTTKEMGWEIGLGLSSAYGIIRSHGGIINISSVIMEGTTYNIYLPAGDNRLRSQATFASGQKTILLVDDKHIIVEVGDQMLMNMGYTCIAVRDGYEALEVFKRHQDSIDLVLLDMVLPGMGGKEVFDGLKKINPNVKVLLASGYGVTDQVKELLSRGCSGYIQKPFDLATLSKEVNRIINA